MSFLSAEALALLLDRQAAGLELYAAQWTPASADVVQESFIELLRQDRPPSNVAAWLYRVVRNRAINDARSLRRRKNHEAARGIESASWFVPSPGDALDAEAAAESLAELPESQREVIVARLWGQLTFEEIADLAGVSVSTAHRRYAAGIAALRERLNVTWLNQERSLTS